MRLHRQSLIGEPSQVFGVIINPVSRRRFSRQHIKGVRNSEATASLDLAFALDGSYTSRVGPLPTFTRASSATRIRADGLLETVGNNVARIDYDVATLACRGLLIEEQRTNQCLQSVAFASGWGAFGPTVTLNSASSPTGGIDAATLTFGADASQLYAQFFNPPAGTYTVSIWARSATSKQFRLGLTPNLSGNFVATSSWARYAFTSVWDAVGGAVFVQNGSSGAAGALQISRPQVELGPNATSYIPTTSTVITRSADVCALTGGNFTGIWGVTEGGIIVDASRLATVASTWSGGQPRAVEVNDASANNLITLRAGVGVGEIGQVVTGGATQAEITAGALVAANTPFALAMRYRANDFAVSRNGAAVVTDVSGTVPTVTRLDIGYSSATASRILNGHIRRLRVYPAALTDAQLQALTT